MNTENIIVTTVVAILGGAVQSAVKVFSERWLSRRMESQRSPCNATAKRRFFQRIAWTSIFFTLVAVILAALLSVFFRLMGVSDVLGKPVSYEGIFVYNSFFALSLYYLYTFFSMLKDFNDLWKTLKE